MCAINGPGYFVLKQDGNLFYTRNGAFGLSSNNNLVSNMGWNVQGLGIDNQFNIVQDVQQNIEIPIGTLTFAQATTVVRFSGNLNADGLVATQGSIHVSDVLYSDPGATIPALATDALNAIVRQAGNPPTATSRVPKKVGQPARITRLKSVRPTRPAATVLAPHFKTSRDFLRTC